MGFADREIHIQKKGSSLRSFGLGFLFVNVGITSIFIPLMVICLVFKIVPEFNESYFNQTKHKEHTQRPGQISGKVANLISIPLGIFFIVILTTFYKKRNHYLINFRPITLCMLTGGCSAIYSVALPYLLAYQSGTNLKRLGSCVFSVVFTEIFATMSMMANISRYFKLYLLNRRDIGKMKLYNDSYDSAFPGKEESVDGFEPNAYVKRLNNLVSKRITVVFFVLPYTLLIILAVFILCKYHDSNRCDSNAIIFYAPIMLLSFVTLFLVPFFFIELYKSRAINRINQLDMIINYFSLFIGSLLFVFTLFAFRKSGAPENEYLIEFTVNLKSTSLLFIIPSFGSCICANVIPLIEAYLADRKLKKKKFLSKKDFTRLLLGSSYVEALKSVAVRSYCVETVIFWEMHLKLMKKINNDEETKQQRLSIEHMPNKKRAPSMTNSIPSPTSPLSPNYDLLLGLNKNIFGSSNNEILYTGGFGEEIDQNLINAINHGANRGMRDYYPMNNRNRAFSDSRVNNQNYMNPAIQISSNNSYPNNAYYYSNRSRNDSMLSLSSNNSFTQNYYLDTMNSDKVELLNKRQGNTYGSNTTAININTGLVRNRRNATRNPETEILYDVFEVDPENTEVPQKFWKEYDNLYNSFISDQSLATVNLDIDTVNRLKRSLANKEYTKDMFFPALAETVELIYQNLYPKLLAR